MRLARFAVVALAVAVAGPAPADTFLLDDGTRVAGDAEPGFVGADGKPWLRVRTAFGRVSFPKASLKRQVAAGKGTGTLRVPSVQVTSLSGEVAKRRPGADNWSAISPRKRATAQTTELPANIPDVAVAPGDRVRTGPGAAIEMDVGFGVVVLGESSEVELAAAEGAAAVRVVRGEAGLDLDALPAGSEFRVETAQASMGVRGTSFVVRVGETTRLAVATGVVDISGLAVAAGAAAELAAGGAPQLREPDDDDRAAFERLRLAARVPRIDWVRVPAGVFEFGDNPALGLGSLAAKPELRSVRVEAFELGRTEVTIAQYALFRAWILRTGDHSFCHPEEPEGFDHAPWAATGAADEDPNLPATGMSWFSAYSFCAWCGGRLPTDEQWEYAARAARALRPKPDRAASLRDVLDQEWTARNSGDRTLGEDEIRAATAPSTPLAGGPAEGTMEQILARNRNRMRPAGTAKPNPFGLHDMLGNVCEMTGTWIPTPAGARIALVPTAVVRGLRWDSTDYTAWSGFVRVAPPDPPQPLGFRIARPVR